LNNQVGQELVHLLDQRGLLLETSETGVEHEGTTGRGEEPLDAQAAPDTGTHHVGKEIHRRQARGDALRREQRGSHAFRTVLEEDGENVGWAQAGFGVSAEVTDSLGNGEGGELRHRSADLLTDRCPHEDPALEARRQLCADPMCRQRHLCPVVWCGNLAHAEHVIV